MELKNKPSLLFLLSFVFSSLLGCSEAVDSGHPEGLIRQNLQGIIGGESSSEGEPLANSTVMLLNLKANELCSGTLIHQRVVLTAAHCVDANPEEINVFFNTAPMRGVVDISGHEVVKIAAHPEYDPKNSFNSIDLALVLLRDFAPSNYHPAIIDQDSILSRGQEVLLFGFGRNVPEKQEGVGVLRKVRSVISSSYKNFFEIDQTMGRGICDGDSGGPVFVKKEQSYALVGVAKMDFDSQRAGAESCQAMSQFTAVNSGPIKVWITNSIEKTLAVPGIEL